LVRVRDIIQILVEFWCVEWQMASPPLANGAATIGKWRRHPWQMASPPLANGAAIRGKWRRDHWQMAPPSVANEMATGCHFFKKNVIFQFFFLNVWGVSGRFGAFRGVLGH
jgi:hypothetical protein